MRVMKKILFFAALLVVWQVVAQEPLSAELAYRMVTDDQAEVTITVSGKGRPTLKLPAVDGGHWLKNQLFEGSSMRSTYVNGRGTTVYSYTYTLPLVLTTTSAVTIPPVVVSLDRERTETASVTIPARNERTAKMRDVGNGVIDLSQLSATLTFVGGAAHFVGETINFALEIAVPEPAELEDIDLPEFPNSDKLVFLKKRDAALISHQPQRRGDFTIYRFDGALKATKSGDFSTAALLQVSLVFPSARCRNDFFFRGSMGTRVIRSVICQSESKSLKIAPLPSLPENAYDLNLAGKWSIQTRFSPEKIQTGEVLTLVVEGRGDRSAAALLAPKLVSDKFRIYPPAVQRSGDRFKIEYTLIPLTPGKAEVDFPFAVFDPETGKYQVFHAKGQWDVTPGAAGITSPASPEKVEQRPAENARSEFFYLRTAGKNSVAMPLWKQGVSRAVVILIVAAVLAAVALFWCKRRIFAPVWRKRSRKRALHQLLMKADGKELAARFPDAVGALLQMPPGTTAAEIAAKIDDPMVREALEKCGKSDFMPGASAWEPDRGTRALLWAHVKHLVILLAALLPLMPMAGDALFDAGRFEDAAKAFEAKYDPRRPDVDLLYNIAASHFHAGDHASARLALRRAQLLAPRDREIASHLAEVEKKLQLPAKKTSGWAYRIDRVIGTMRPDEWIVLASVILALWVILIGFYPLIPRAGRWTAGGVAVLALCFCLFAFQQEKHRLYHHDQAVAVRETSLRSLPSASGGKAESSLPAGSDVRILKVQGEWALVESGNGRGWVALGDVEKLFPAELW